MTNKNIARVPDGITRENVEFVERRKTDSKYNVSTHEKIAAVFNVKFSAFAAELEMINPHCSVARARAIWAMRSHFIKEIEVTDFIDDEDILYDEDELDAMIHEIPAAPVVAPRPRRVTTVYKRSRRIVSKEVARIIKSLTDLQLHLVEKPQ